MLKNVIKILLIPSTSKSRKNKSMNTCCFSFLVKITSIKEIMNTYFFPFFFFWYQRSLIIIFFICSISNINQYQIQMLIKTRNLPNQSGRSILRSYHLCQDICVRPTTFVKM